MPTISDVAKRSGLSKSTVSRVLNNYPHVSEEKKERVQKAMAELEYTPNPSARKMRGALTTTIGVVVTRIVNPFFSYLVNAIEQVAYEQGYQVVVFQSNEDQEKELSFLQLMQHKQLDGIIMASIENDEEVIETYLAYGPIVFVNEYIQHMNTVPSVRINHIAAAYEGVMHLLNQGHRRIAYCTGGLFEQQGQSDDRNIGYKKALAEKGIEVDPQFVFVNKHTIEDGESVGRAIFQMKEQPTAVFTGSDEVAAGVIAAAHELNQRVPEDLAVVGFDDQPIAKITYPKLTTIKQPVDDMGRLAANLMIEALNGTTPTENETVLETKFVERDTT
ncbi:LacI family transcriptional regulator [Salsuginibacillus halophilus]|uniref:LacI family transcriptional regulator n=1 Tax=Salsuginibacillus halophilus TaxID=517424 RepID=A0A2P8HAK5_9BACI|nr:LacI family DNA-binding transcriptional regulator [Salsuginibacillus halophilus]PSL43256.1 LacI family transcriptional regulator [Salsuginibacillus halophilus]